MAVIYLFMFTVLRA